MRILALTRNTERARANLWTLALLLLLAIGAVACGDVSNAPAPTPGPGALTIATIALPNGIISQPYATDLGGTGGTTPYSWSVTPTVPAGLTFDLSSGTLSGIPTTTSNLDHTFTLRDATGQTVQKVLHLTITTAPVPPMITTPSPLPAGTINQPYPQTTLAATGGTLPYSWSVTPALPSGLVLNVVSPGTISGTPLSGSAGTKSYTFTVTDSTSPFNQTATKLLSLTINLTVPPLTIAFPTGTSLPNGKVGDPYNQTFLASGGTPPYTWSVSPALPAPFQLNGATGTITGTPTATANFSRTYTVRDSTLPTNLSTSRTISLRVTN